MSFVVYFDLSDVPKTCDTALKAIDVATQFLLKRADGLIVRQMDDGNFVEYSVPRLTRQLEAGQEVALQLTDKDGDVFAEVVNIVPAELDAKQRKESAAELAELGQSLADSYGSAVALGKTEFKPKG